MLAAMRTDAGLQIRRHPALAVSRYALAVLFILAGANHFRDPGFYLAIMPPALPAHGLLVAISGAAEIAGGIGLLVPALRRWAGFGLIALLIAVFPANLAMATEGLRPPGVHLPAWVAWARLPLQAVLIAWVWVAACREPRRAAAIAGDPAR